MGNSIRGQATVKLGGKEYSYRLNWGTMAAFESSLQARTGERESFGHFLTRAQDWSIEELILLVLVGLKKSHPDVTEELLAEELTLEDQMTFRMVFMGLCQESMGPHAQKAKGGTPGRPQTPQEAQTGTNS